MKFNKGTLKIYNMFGYDITKLINDFIEVKDYLEYKKEFIKKFHDMGFAIFPCNLDKTPITKSWNYLTLRESKRLFTKKSSLTYGNTRLGYYNNIGLLCGRKSKIFVIDIDLKDNGINYWNSLLRAYNDGKDINSV